MSHESTTSAGEIRWEPQPEAWLLLLDLVERSCRANPQIHSLRQHMLDQTGTRLIDWLDHVCVDSEELADATLTGVGYRFCDQQQAWHHPRGLFPRIVRPRRGSDFPTVGLAIKVESVEDFLNANSPSQTIEIQGQPFSDLRYAIAFPHASFGLIVCERRGNLGWSLESRSGQQIDAVLDACHRFVVRPRPLDAAVAGFEAARRAFDTAASQLGPSWACDLFFLTERQYWQSRNRAAQIQHARQQSLGLGWANHDHHTYRCSREHFASLVALLEHMGFECRERFYAGAQAGWGAQVLEHPQCRFVVFADVDMSPGEVTGDFSHEGLAPRQELGTVGMWCKLHGEAMLHAGLHHLECQFDFDAVRLQLAAAGVETMAPFTDFPFLRQAFTVGEQWDIDSSHLEHLCREGWITNAELDEFALHGARGSHLEVLERNDGYKGFNQTGISEIIAKTDPRKAVAD